VLVPSKFYEKLPTDLRLILFILVVVVVVE